MWYVLIFYSNYNGDEILKRTLRDSVEKYDSRLFVLDPNKDTFNTISPYTPAIMQHM